MRGFEITPEQLLELFAIRTNQSASPNPGLAPYFGPSMYSTATCPDWDKGTDKHPYRQHSHDAVMLYESIGDEGPYVMITIDHDLVTDEYHVVPDETVRQTVAAIGAVVDIDGVIQGRGSDGNDYPGGMYL